MEQKPPNVTVEYYWDTQSQKYIRLFHIEPIENSLFDLVRVMKTVAGDKEYRDSYVQVNYEYRADKT